MPKSVGDEIKRDPNSLTIIVVDAGQGDCILILYPDDSLVLVDCGRNPWVSKHLTSDTNDAIEQTVKRCLSQCQPPQHLKALVLTHPDADHYNLFVDLVLPHLR